MAYEYHNDDGTVGIGGDPSKEEIAAGEAQEDECEAFKKLYGDD